MEPAVCLGSREENGSWKIMTAVHMLENVLPKFRKTHSEINTSIVDCSNLENAIYALENDNVDAAFVTAYSETLFPGNAEVMAREEIVLGVPSALPFCKRYSTEAFSTVTMEGIFILAIITDILMPVAAFLIYRKTGNGTDQSAKGE